VSWQISKAGKLVAIASSMRSTTEMRAPGQAGKPDEIVVKGSNDGSDWTSKPVQLSEAEAIVKQYCPTRPDAKCLEIRDVFLAWRGSRAAQQLLRVILKKRSRCVRKTRGSRSSWRSAILIRLSRKSSPI